MLRVDSVRSVEEVVPRRVSMETGGHIVPSARRMTALQCPTRHLQIRGSTVNM